MSVAFDVLGTPAPKGSSRPMLNRKTGIAFSFAGGSPVTERKIKAWSTAVREMSLETIGERAEPVYVREPLSVEIVFRMVRPMGHWGKGRNAGRISDKAPIAPMGKPDIDKLVRTTLDAMTGLVFDDDSRIARLVATKEWAMPGHEGARIVVSALAVAVTFAGTRAVAEERAA